MGGALATYATAVWHKFIIKSVALSAHAQTSVVEAVKPDAPLNCAGAGAPTVAKNSQGIPDSLVDFLFRRP